MVTLMTALYLADLRARGPRLGEAARVAGAARDRVSARSARPLVSDAAARLRRPAVVSVADEGSVSRSTTRPGSVGLGSAAPLFGALADRFTQTRLRRLDRRPLHLAARRRRARRGEHLGGARRAADAPARRTSSGSSTSTGSRSTVSSRGSGRPSWRRSSASNGWDVIELKYGQPAARGVRPGGRRPAAARGSTRCRTSSISRSSAPREEVVRDDRPRRARRRTSAPSCGRLLDDYAGRGGAARARPRWPRPRRRARRAPAGARDARPADGDLRLHDQGVRPRDRRAARRTTRRSSTATRSTGCARRWA